MSGKAETVAELFFKDLAREVGTKTLKGVIDISVEEQTAGREGVTLVDEDQAFKLATSPDGISFSLGREGPFMLSAETAQALIIDMEDNPAAL